jgi:hypothetical protein
MLTDGLALPPVFCFGTEGWSDTLVDCNFDE